MPRIAQDSPTHTTGEPSDIVLTVEEAAKRLRIGRTLMYSLIKSGEIRSVPIGRLRRVPVRCIDEYVNKLLNHVENIPAAA
jgi:excisionase family DNA binding protein